MKKILLIKAKEVKIKDFEDALNYVRHTYPDTRLAIFAYDLPELEYNEFIEINANEKIACQHVKASNLFKIIIRIWLKRFNKVALVITSPRDYSQLITFMHLTLVKEKTVYDINSKREIPLSSFLKKFRKKEQKPSGTNHLKEIGLIVWRNFLFFAIIVLFIIFIAFPLRLRKALNK